MAGKKKMLQEINTQGEKLLRETTLAPGDKDNIHKDLDSLNQRFVKVSRTPGPNSSMYHVAMH